MTRTYTITKRTQYDPNGATVVHNGLRCGFGADGSYLAGHLPTIEDQPAVDAAVARVIATGQAETLTLGTSEAEPVLPEWRSERGLALSQEMDAEDTIY